MIKIKALWVFALVFIIWIDLIITNELSKEIQIK
jgi:hypothetical protein